MAYDPAALSCGFQLLGGKYNVWVYQSTDSFSGTVDASAYFSNGIAAGMALNDFVFVIDTDAAANVTMAYVSAVSSTAATVTAVATSGAGGSFTTLSASGASTLAAVTATNITATGTVLLGDAAADLIGFYGGTGASQRASSVQATTNIASSTDFGATQLAVVQEIMNTLTGMKLWKGSA